MWIRVLILFILGTHLAAAQTPTPLSCDALIPPSDSGAGRFGDVAEGRGGRLAWTDGRPGQVLVRDGAGKVRVIGRSGAGPGEFDRPSQLVWRGDTLIVSDWRLRRVQAFSDTGQLLRTLTALVPGTWAALADDRLVTIRSVGLSDESSRPYALVSQQPAALSMDTIATFPNPAVARFERLVGKRVVRNHQPFQPRSLAIGTRDGSRFCGVSPEGNGTRLRCTDGVGRELLNRVLQLPLRPLTDAVYDSVVRIHLIGGNREGDLRSKIQRPRSLPPVFNMMVDLTGEIWLQRSHDTEPNAVWMRIRPAGSIRDEITISRRFRFIRPEGDFIWAATADSDGLESLHKCRIGRR